MNDTETPPLPDDIAALLPAARRTPVVAPGVRDAVLARVQQTVGALPPLPGHPSSPHAGPSLPPAAAASGSGAASTLFGGPLVKFLAIAVLAGGGIVSWRVFGGNTSATPQRAVSRPVNQVATSARPESQVALPTAMQSATPTAPALSTASTASSLAAQTPISTANPAAPTTPPGPATASTPRRTTPVVVDEHDDALRAERELLEPARQAIGEHEGARALTALEQHRRQFPHGRLAEERDAMRVQALALSGNHEGAQEAAERFRRASPRSVFLPVIDAALRNSP